MKKSIQDRISKGIEKLVREYKETGKITTSRATYKPKNLKHAQKIAAAIEYGRIRQEGIPIRRKPKGSGYFTEEEIKRGYKILWRPK